MRTDEAETQQIQEHIHHQRKTRGPEILNQCSTHSNSVRAANQKLGPVV